jgi:predicted lipoprotein with Yx(FWY)xxD motif
MRRTIGLMTSVVALGTLIFGLTAYQGAQAAAPTAAAHATVQVAIQNFAFSPQKLTVASGTMVTWTNKDSAAHTVTSDTSAWADSGSLATNKSFSFTFTKPGTYAYHCAVHPNMTATITVTGAAGSATSQASGALVKLASAHILVSAKGFTLYVFAPDPKGKSTCYTTCAKYWPPLVAPKGTKVPSSMAGVSGTFGLISRTDGSQQMAYDGAPLYTFVGDKEAGDMYGQGSTASGGFWWVVVAGNK